MYNCLECNDTFYRRVFIFNKDTYENLADNNKDIISMGNFQESFSKTLSSGEVSFENVYVFKSLHHLNNLYKLTDGRVSESKAHLVYAEPCENCMAKAFIRMETVKEDKPRKRKEYK